MFHDLFTSHFSILVGIVATLIFAARLLREGGQPSFSFAWLLGFLLIPYIALPAYLIFGVRGRLPWGKEEVFPFDEEEKQEDCEAEPREDKVELVLTCQGMPPARADNKIELITDSEDAFKRTFDAIAMAHEEICIQTFIFAKDYIGELFVDLLSRKAQEGVKVYLLIDGLGSFMWVLLGGFRRLRAAGARVEYFRPAWPPSYTWSINLRNHRKVMVIDKKIAFTGGMNLGRVYMGDRDSPETWVDSTLQIEGPIVRDLYRVFAADWKFRTDEQLQIPDPVAEKRQRGELKGLAQIVIGGPDVHHRDAMHDAIMTAFGEATRRLWVVTPYYIPDDALERTLLIQAMLGRDVRMITPAKTDHKVVNIVRRRFFRRFLQAGGKLYYLPERMLHAKHILVDDRLCMAGSPNLDNRSLYYNYEVALFLYSDNEVAAVKNYIESLFERCYEVTEIKGGRTRMWAEDLGTLISPLI